MWQDCGKNRGESRDAGKKIEMWQESGSEGLKLADFPHFEVNKINDLFENAENAESVRKLESLLYKDNTAVSASPHLFLKFLGNYIYDLQIYAYIGGNAEDC